MNEDILIKYLAIFVITIFSLTAILDTVSPKQQEVNYESTYNN